MFWIYENFYGTSTVQSVGCGFEFCCFEFPSNCLVYLFNMQVLESLFLLNKHNKAITSF